MRVKKILSRVLLLASLCTLLTISAQADAVTDTIGVYIGYFGWSEDQYVEKASWMTGTAAPLTRTRSFTPIIMAHARIWHWDAGFISATFWSTRALI